MAVNKIAIEQFLKDSAGHLILDVRSPGEYKHAHIPGAKSLPLFDDEERKVIGTLYKQQSREHAIREGLDFFGPKMRVMVELAERETQKLNSRKIFIHCWRGGMRSGAVAWLLDLYGFEVSQLDGGYKSFRNWVLAQFEKPYYLRILSGYTGSGKTEILHVLSSLGERVLDLEGLAGHKGSAFGGIGLPPQPTTEQFENKMALALKDLEQGDTTHPIWVESESNFIGAVNLPHLFMNQMRQAERVHVDVPFEERLKKTVADYGVQDMEKLKEAVVRIQKRLGGLETQRTLAFLDEGNISEAFRILLKYYDKFYEKGTLFQEPFARINLPSADGTEDAKILLNEIKKLK